MQFSHQDESPEELHDINVTPFIDVMLVLLIIFMVAAPLATVDIQVTLPTAATEPTTPPDSPVILTLKADLSLRINGEPVADTALTETLNQAMKEDKQQPIFLRADKTVDYEHLIALMDKLRNAGYLNMALVALESPTTKG